MRRRTKLEQLEERADYLRQRLAQGHRNQAVVTRWKRELLRTRAMVLAVQNGKRPSNWEQYKGDVGEWPAIES